MIKYAYALAIGSALALAACATQPGTSTNPTVAMTPVQLAAEANVVLEAFTAGVSAYEASATTPVPPVVQTSIMTAENVAGALIKTIATSDTSTAAADALAVANGLSAAANQIPSLPVNVKAGVLAFQVFVAAIEPVIQAQNTTAPGPAGATLHTAHPMFGLVHIKLVPNPAK